MRVSNWLGKWLIWILVRTLHTTLHYLGSHDQSSCLYSRLSFDPLPCGPKFCGHWKHWWTLRLIHTSHIRCSMYVVPQINHFSGAFDELKSVYLKSHSKEHKFIWPASCKSQTHNSNFFIDGWQEFLQNHMKNHRLWSKDQRLARGLPALQIKIPLEIHFLGPWKEYGLGFFFNHFDSTPWPA